MSVFPVNWCSCVTNTGAPQNTKDLINLRVQGEIWGKWSQMVTNGRVFYGEIQG